MQGLAVCTKRFLRLVAVRKRRAVAIPQQVVLVHLDQSCFPRINHTKKLTFGLTLSAASKQSLARSN